MQQAGISGTSLKNSDMDTEHHINHPGLQSDGALVSGLEEHLRALGQELHDNLGQQLAAIGYQAHTLEKKLLASGNTDLASIAASIASQAHDSVVQCKQFAQNLLPVELEASGLADALESFASRIATLHEISCDFMSIGSSHVDDTALALDFYRIAQEATSNAIRHGKARRIQIVLESGNGLLRLSVIDNGCGMAPTISGNAPSPGMGVKIMQYRARRHGAILAFTPCVEGGTEVRVELRANEDVIKVKSPADR